MAGGGVPRAVRLLGLVGDSGGSPLWVVVAEQAETATLV